MDALEKEDNTMEWFFNETLNLDSLTYGLDFVQFHDFLKGARQP